jgi:hypothetical protein
MTDREKVIRGLEACNRRSCNGSDCQNCPYYDDEDTAELPFGICNIQDMVGDALALLKEQKAMIAVACDVLEIYAPDAACDEFSEDEKQWEICSAECKNGLYTKCWERFLKWKLEKRRKPPEQMRETPWEGGGDA